MNGIAGTGEQRRRRFNSIEELLAYVDEQAKKRMKDKSEPPHTADA